MFGFSRIVNRIETSQPEVYLTFDDGPNRELTPRVLDLLCERKALATFFVVGEEARRNRDVLRRIISEGHAVYSHSTDHNFYNYIRSPLFLRRWLRDSLQELEDLTGEKQYIFRPPVGIIPPPLLWAAYSLNVTLVLWNHRFFDSVKPWTVSRAERSLARIKSGDIVLLHDRQREANISGFLPTLNHYLLGLKSHCLVANPLGPQHFAGVTEVLSKS